MLPPHAGGCEQGRHAIAVPRWWTVRDGSGYLLLDDPLFETQPAFRNPAATELFMARIKILRKDGTPTLYFWSDADKTAAEKTVYKQTTDGVKRMKGVHFDATKKRIVKH